jgi:hypothetical protein
MRRVLIRSGKDPFTAVAPESTLTQDVFNSNVGNFLFAHSVHKALMTDGTEVVSNATLSERRRATAEDVARVNDEFDAFVVPLANAFRPDFLHRLENLTSLVEGLTIPVVVVGVGAQADLTLDLDSLAEVRPAATAFVAAVLERSESIGVRGEFTADFVRGLGFPDSAVDVIGCPSLFLHGPDFQVSAARGVLDRGSRIALNVTPGVEDLGAFCMRLLEDHPRVTYIAQDRDDLRLLLWGEEPAGVDPRLPLNLAHPLVRGDRVRFPLDIWTWLDYLRGFDFAVGTRLHGNVAGLLADIPSMLLVHDSRTHELAEFHDLPRRPVVDLAAAPSAEDLYAAFDPTAFNDVYPKRFAGFVEFLDRNGLHHVYEPGQSGAEFERRLGAAVLPPLVGPLGSNEHDEVAARLRWLRDGQAFDSELHLQAYRQPFPVPRPVERGNKHKHAHEAAQRKIARLQERLKAARGRMDRQQATLARQRERLDRQAARLDALELRQRVLENRSVLRRLVRRIRSR